VLDTLSVYCSLVYPARKAYAPSDIVICDLPGCTIISTLSDKRNDFWEKKELLNINCMILLSLQLLSETFLILRIHSSFRMFPESLYL